MSFKIQLPEFHLFQVTGSRVKNSTTFSPGQRDTLRIKNSLVSSKLYFTSFAALLCSYLHLLENIYATIPPSGSHYSISSPQVTLPGRRETATIL